MAEKKSQKKGRVRKRFTTGFEVEFFVIDKNTGAIAHGADDILAKVQEVLKEGAHNITKESAKNLIEAGSYPDSDGANTMTNLIESLKQLLYIADELGLAIVPLGAYPGRFTPSIRSETHYKTQQLLYGKNRFQISGRCAGYHCHNSLPWGIFDSKTLMLKNLAKSKNQRAMVNAYNFLIALDPALTTFMQSSPFYQGKYLAKDSRMVMYRGGRVFGLPTKGLYTNFPFFGALPAYEHSGTDIIHSIEKRHQNCIDAMKEAGVPEKDIPKYRSILTTNWTPVKVNPHGTLEQRGMDMNHLPLVLSASVLIWRTLHYIQEKGYSVVPHDLAKNEPFKLEDKTIYIPPDVHVREHLQKLSALKGFESDEVYTYCKRLVALVKQLDGEKVRWLVKPLETMLEERQTTSDRILAQAKSLGYKDLKKVLPQKIVAEIVKTHSKQMFADIVLLQKMIEGNEKLTS